MPEKLIVVSADWAFSWVGFLFFGLIAMLLLISLGSSTPNSAGVITGDLHAATSRP